MYLLSTDVARKVKFLFGSVHVHYIKHWETLSRARIFIMVLEINEADAVNRLL